MIRRGYVPRIAQYDRHRVGAFKRVRGRPLRDHRGGPRLVLPVRHRGKKRRGRMDPLLAAYRRAAFILSGKEEFDAVEE